MRSLSALRSLTAFELRLALQLRWALAQAVTERDALVEDETLAAPSAFTLRNLFEIIQDAALEVIDLGKTLPEQIARSLFAADAAGAEHRDLSMPRRIEMVGGVILEPAKACDRRIGGAFEGADRNLERVARVDEHRIGRSDQFVPVTRLDIGAD